MPSSGHLYLLFSNLSIVLPVVYSLSLELYSEASLLSTLGVISTIYHACQANFFCVFESNILHKADYKLLQYADEFFVDTTVIWFVLYFLQVDFKYKVPIIFFVQPIFLLSILSQSPHTNTILLVTIFFIIAFMLIRSIILYRIIFIEFISGIMSLVLLVSGFAIFYVGGDAGHESDYSTLHSTWHVLLMIDFYFIIKTKVDSNTYFMIWEIDKRPVKLIHRSELDSLMKLRWYDYMNRNKI